MPILLYNIATLRYNMPIQPTLYNPPFINTGTDWGEPKVHDWPPYTQSDKVVEIQEFHAKLLYNMSILLYSMPILRCKTHKTHKSI